jgi:IMP dehydrogenase/GMP reductase
MQINESLTFGDLLIIPQYSEVESRSLVQTKVSLMAKSKGSNSFFEFRHPVIPANMKSIGSLDLLKQSLLSQGLTLLHRFDTLEEQVSKIKSLSLELERYIKEVADPLEVGTEDIKAQHWSNYIGVSLGVKQEDIDNAEVFYNLGVRIFCIDIAHGHSKRCGDMCKLLKEKYDGILLIAGNVATGEGAKYLWDSGADVVKCGIGSGCLGANTKILMANGTYKKIIDIKDGDLIIDGNGNQTKVVKLINSGKRYTKKIKTNLFHSELEITPDHKVFVGDLNTTNKKRYDSGDAVFYKTLDKPTRKDESKYKWKEIEDLKQDIMLMPRNINFKFENSLNIELHKRYGGNPRSGFKYKLDRTIKDTYDMGYVIGTFLGDGCALSTQHGGSHIGAIKWYFGLDEMDIANKLAKCVENAIDKKVKIQTKKNIIVVSLYYKPMADEFNKFGKLKNKRLPPEYMVENIDYLKGIYDGLIDSDGSIDGERKSLSNTSQEIIELFSVLNFRINGYFPSISKTKITSGNLKGCNIENFSQSFNARTLKKPHVRLTKTHQLSHIMSNDGFEEIETYDIEVESDAHSFIANNNIVHNSICLTRMEAGCGVAQIKALQDIVEVKNSGAKYFSKSIISDGGIVNNGDIPKALAFADMVMIGNMFSGCEETEGNKVIIDGVEYKEYAGSSTHKSKHIEGVVGLVHKKGKFSDILDKMMQGLRSGCSYVGAFNIGELKYKVKFNKITQSGLRESNHHDVKIL